MSSREDESGLVGLVKTKLVGGKLFRKRIAAQGCSLLACTALALPALFGNPYVLYLPACDG